MPTLSARELDRLTTVDELDHMGFVALLGDDIIGMASYDVWPGSNEAEVAFIIDDAHHGRGIATLLLEYLVVAAREHGLDALTAQVLPNNRRMVAVFHQVGFEVASSFADGLIEVRLDLEPTPAERGADRGTGATVRGPFGRAAALPVVGRGDRRRAASRTGSATRCSATCWPTDFTGPCTRSTRRPRPSTACRATRRWPTRPATIDLAIVAVPAHEPCRGGRGVRPQASARAGGDQRGARRTSSSTGVPIERAVVERALRFGMRVIGPESLGVINTAPDSPLLRHLRRPSKRAAGPGRVPHPVGHARHRRVGARPPGRPRHLDVRRHRQSADVSGNDLLQFWWDDPRTSVVLLYLETFGNPRKFTRIAREMARTKPIVAVKSGRTLAAEQDDPSGGLATVWPADATADALLAQSGVIRVETPPELFAVARVLLHQPMPAGRRVAVVSNSKGASTLAVDACARAGARGRAGRDDDLGRRVPTTTRRRPAEALADDDVDAMLLVYAPPVRERRDEIVGRGRREHRQPRGPRGGHRSPCWRRSWVAAPSPRSRRGRSRCRCSSSPVMRPACSGSSRNTACGCRSPRANGSRPIPPRSSGLGPVVESVARAASRRAGGSTATRRRCCCGRRRVRGGRPSRRRLRRRGARGARVISVIRSC